MLGGALKVGVYTGAKLLAVSSPILCPVLLREPSNNYTEEPILYVFNNAHNVNQSMRIYPDDEITKELVEKSRFDPEANTFIIVHGWLTGVNTTFYQQAGKNIALGATVTGGSRLRRMERQKYRPNVILVDWSQQSRLSLWSASAALERVARRLAQKLRQLAIVGGLKPELMHCIGHSFGAHICGQTARFAFPAGSGGGGGNSSTSLGRMGRVTALDPSGQCFELGVKDESTYVGVRPSDALLVDALISNNSPFGNIYNLAQYNLQINNGRRQENCSVLNPEVATSYFVDTVGFLLGNQANAQTITCDHFYATRFLYEELSPICSFIGYTCQSYEDYVRGRCGECSGAEQCYAIDNEFQKALPSVEHSLEHIARHSSYLDPFSVSRNQAPAGSVQYDNRRVYYIRTQNGTPYCSECFLQSALSVGSLFAQSNTEFLSRTEMTYRISVQLNDTLDVSASFRTEQFKLQVYDSSGRVLSVVSAVNDEPTSTIGLFGPWTSDGQANSAFGLDDKTLTALIELDKTMAASMLELGADQFTAAPIGGVAVIYKMGNNWDPNGFGLRNPVYKISFDYLSASNEE